MCHVFTEAEESTQEEIEHDAESNLVQYPDNLNLKDMFYFIFAPTLCYELNFPRTQRIRKRFLLKRIFEVVVGIQIIFAVMQQYMIPSVKNSLIPFSNMDVTKATERLLKLAVGKIILFECTFDGNFGIVSDTESLGVAVHVLHNVPFVFELDRGAASVCRSQFLSRLVEREQYRHFLEELEYAGAPLGIETPVYSVGFHGLRQNRWKCCCIFRQCIFP